MPTDNIESSKSSSFAKSKVANGNVNSSNNSNSNNGGSSSNGNVGGSNGGKKKYGKNLNKLVFKPTNAPPIPKSVRTASGSSHNGLLLLSTKKSKGALAAAATKPAAIVYDNNTLSSQNTRGLLLNAVAGASGTNGNLNPDAWGVVAATSGSQKYATFDNNDSNSESGSSNKVENANDDGYSATFDSTSPVAQCKGEDKAVYVNTSDNDYDRRPANNSAMLWEPSATNKSKAVNYNNDSTASADDEPVAIQLSSYEDRDRGLQPSSAPRMLYDPKSGCMVQVKAREESKQRKSNTPKKSSFSKKNSIAKVKDGTEPKSSRKGKKESKNTVAVIQKQDLAILAKRTEPVKRMIVTRKVPRTLGVLYTRDSKGHFYCADDCEAELGYGSHSVPGGRVKNPEAYAKYAEENEDYYAYPDVHSPSMMSAYSRAVVDSNIRDAYMKKRSGSVNTDPQDKLQLETGLQTGFKLEEPVNTQLDWVKAGEKIELVCGEDDSPVLKPTAKEWAPSQGAMAAASSAILSRKEVMDAYEKGSDIELNKSHDANLSNFQSVGPSIANEEVDDEDNEENFGLGFDPTLDMDFVMHSPSSSPKKTMMEDIDVGIESLALGPSLYDDAQADAVPKHFFPFSSSGTWGGKSEGSSSNSAWGIGGNGSSERGLMSSAVFPIEEKKDSSHYLSIVPGASAWSSSLGSLGFGGMHDASNTKTSAD